MHWGASRAASAVLLLLLFTAAPACVHAADNDEVGPARSPQEALATLHVPDGLRVELVAFEPLVIDPVAIDFGPDGRLWVAEMHDYPAGLNGDYQPAGRIRVLEDSDGDGRYDKVSLFLDGIAFPTGVMLWRNGVLICAAPDILYAEDTDGDGRADVKKVLLTGFDPRNYQARVNGLRYGLDNWVYGANGLLGGKLTSPQKADFSVDLGSRDFRMKPDTLDFDLEPGRTQQGRDHDDWGDWFGCNNSELLLHYPLPDHYVRRNPHVAAADPVVTVPKEDPDKLYPRSRTLPRFNHPESANRVTSACSPIVYRDELLGPEYVGNAFICEPVHNLVTRRVLKPEGSTFAGVRAPGEQQSEFLTSTDNWFRPVELRTGPDGAIWVVDMYRAIIEHPKWITADRLETLNVRAGDDLGRIYRIVPADGGARKPVRLDTLDAAGLVAALDHANGTQRDAAQALLVERNDQSAIGPLKKLATRGRRPQSRMQALCTLDGLHGLDADLLSRALHDPHPGVRRHAIRLCEAMLPSDPRLGEELVRLVDDSDPHVRLQLACTLGEWHDPRAGEALGRIALASQQDPYITGAVLSSITKNNLPRFAAVITADVSTAPPSAFLHEQVVSLASAYGVDSVLVAFVESLRDRGEGPFPTWQLTTVAALIDGLERAGLSPEKWAAQHKDNEPALRSTLEAVFNFARATSADAEADLDTRLAALRLLGRAADRQEADIEALGTLLSPQTPNPLQKAAVETLGRLRHPAVPGVLLGEWRRVGPSLRSEILDVLMSRDEWTAALLDRIEQEELRASEIDATRSQQLTGHKNKALGERATKLLAASINTDRAKVAEQYKSAASLAGHVDRGAVLFEKTCSVCHRLNGKGYSIGPDLVALTDKSPEALLVAILDPNRAVEQKFTVYNAVTMAGRSYPGILTAETGSSITLTQQENKQTTIIRSDLEELVSTGKSLMPDGLEKDLKPQDLADIMAYVASTGPSRRTFPGNVPALVTVSPDGTLMLTAQNCEIYGSSLTFEEVNPERKILTEWKHGDDRADWTIDVPGEGEYTVSVHYSCQNDSAGNVFLLETATGKISAKVGGTGATWSTYFPVEIGKVKLHAGKQRVTLRAENEIRGALANVAHVLLIPSR